ncbi:hypothetical protein DLAC_05801 [Tieghemostelium lacteum]|uniref:Uncharacterized protein n=1 Tax=Tieghemostelium lacteum TaxID=361077 RepID=A0A151ZGX3_TIELA|nr:hypothetical protein DLAC_05801 [Tieghemostelium lacteum]|eukprot:KYQ93167.1 hypothetical protein DLAC_05801 [Tieghemostelium lacteum]
MNLFVLDKNTKTSVRYHCDKHVVKLILEAIQMLYCAFHILDEGNDDWKKSAPSTYMKLTHKNHPINKWVRLNDKTYDYTLEYASELLQEYTLRYSKIHSSHVHYEWLSKNKPKNIVYSNSSSVPVMPLAMPDQYKSLPTVSWDDVVTSYRNYYLGEKLSFCSYKGVDWPDWIPVSSRPVKVPKPKQTKTRKQPAKKRKSISDDEQDNDSDVELVPIKQAKTSNNNNTSKKKLKSK